MIMNDSKDKSTLSLQTAVYCTLNIWQMFFKKTYDKWCNAQDVGAGERDVGCGGMHFGQKTDAGKCI